MAGMVIVGGGQAGYSVASKLRTAGYEGDVTIICSENCLPYQRPPLSKKFLMGDVPKERLLFRPMSFYDENNIKVKLGVTVVKIERIKCEISLSDKCKISYKKLFITTGATPNKFPEVLGGDLRKVYYLRSLEDIESMMIEFKPNNKFVNRLEKIPTSCGGIVRNSKLLGRAVYQAKEQAKYKMSEEKERDAIKDDNSESELPNWILKGDNSDAIPFMNDIDVIKFITEQIKTHNRIPGTVKIDVSKVHKEKYYG